MKKRNILLGLALAFCFTACYDLDKMPEGVLSTAEPFRSTGEIRNYIDRYYEFGVRTQGFMAGGGGGIAGNDVNSDNLASAAVNSRLMGLTSLSNAVALDNYTHIRNINFLINNAGDCPEKGSVEYNHLMGEAYYFRAWFYYSMFSDYGRLAWVDTPLEPNLEVMMLPRESRTFIADKILADLDMAISLMKEQNNSSSMRLHKDVARALKSEVALFEATWEKYHRAENDPFYDKTLTNPDAKIKEWLELAATAAKEVIDRNVWSIHSTGKPLTDYRDMFIDTDLSDNQEVLWWKEYNASAGIGHNVTYYACQGGGQIGVSASLVDDYLTIDGKPFTGNAKLEAKRTYGAELSPNCVTRVCHRLSSCLDSRSVTTVRMAAAGCN